MYSTIVQLIVPFPGIVLHDATALQHMYTSVPNNIIVQHPLLFLLKSYFLSFPVQKRRGLPRQHVSRVNCWPQWPQSFVILMSSMWSSIFIPTQAIVYGYRTHSPKALAEKLLDSGWSTAPGAFCCNFQPNTLDKYHEGHHNYLLSLPA